MSSESAATRTGLGNCAAATYRESTQVQAGLIGCEPIRPRPRPVVSRLAHEKGGRSFRLRAARSLYLLGYLRSRNFLGLSRDCDATVRATEPVSSSFLTALGPPAAFTARSTAHRSVV